MDPGSQSAKYELFCQFVCLCGSVAPPSLLSLGNIKHPGTFIVAALPPKEKKKITTITSSVFHKDILFFGIGAKIRKCQKIEWSPLCGLNFLYNSYVLSGGSFHHPYPSSLTLTWRWWRPGLPSFLSSSYSSLPRTRSRSRSQARTRLPDHIFSE